MYVLTSEILILTKSIINLWFITHSFPLSVSTQHTTLMQQESIQYTLGNSKKIIICTWKGFYHNGRQTKEYNPFPYALSHLKKQAMLWQLVSSGTCTTFASEQGTAVVSKSKVQ